MTKGYVIKDSDGKSVSGVNGVPSLDAKTQAIWSNKKHADKALTLAKKLFDNKDLKVVPL